jgi:hypothetical protein
MGLISSNYPTLPSPNVGARSRWQSAKRQYPRSTSRVGRQYAGKTKPGSRKTVLEETGNIAEVDAQNSVIFLLCLPN